MAGSEEDVYDVEAIIKDRIVGGRKQYYIKWLGYPSSQNTWEFEENIFCEELKKEYEAKKNQPKAPKDNTKKNTPKFTKKVTDEWLTVVKKVTGVSKNKNGHLEVEYVTFDGNKSVCPSEEIHIKAPIKLLEFYEENLSFPE